MMTFSQDNHYFRVSIYARHWKTLVNRLIHYTINNWNIEYNISLSNKCEQPTKIQNPLRTYLTFANVTTLNQSIFSSGWMQEHISAKPLGVVGSRPSVRIFAFVQSHTRLQNPCHSHFTISALMELIVDLELFAGHVRPILPGQHDAYTWRILSVHMRTHLRKYMQMRIYLVCYHIKIIIYFVLAKSAPAVFVSALCYATSNVYHILPIYPHMTYSNTLCHAWTRSCCHHDRIRQNNRIESNEYEAKNVVTKFPTKIAGHLGPVWFASDILYTNQLTHRFNFNTLSNWTCACISDTNISTCATKNHQVGFMNSTWRSFMSSKRDYIV